MNNNQEIKDFWAAIEKEIRELFPDLIKISYDGDHVTIITKSGTTWTYVID